jgi:hypothetical protein
VRTCAAAVALLLIGTAAALAGPEGDVFEVSPLETPELVRVPLGLPDGADRLATAAVAVLNCPDTDRCSEIYPGTYYHACQPTALAVPDADGNFLYPFAGDTAPEDELPEVMAFYQVGEALAVTEALGLDGLAEPLQVVVNVRHYDGGSLADCADGSYDGDVPLEPIDTAWFTTDGEGIGVDRTGFTLVLPQGHAVDLALDGDVVHHELGHAVMASLAPGLPRTRLDEYGTDPSPGGLHEGFADLLAVMVSGDPVIGEYAGSGVGDGSPLRDLGDDARCPDDVTGEAHADSRPFTSAVWAARQAVTASDEQRAGAFDRAVMSAWIRLGEDAGYQRAASLIADEVEAALGADTGSSARAIFAEHGMDGCGGRVVDAATGKPLALLPAVADPERGGTAPAIFQLRLELDRRASDITLEVAGFDTGAPDATDVTALLSSSGEPITWTLSGSGEPISDADLVVPLAVDDDRHARAVFAGSFEPGVYHLQLANHGGRATLYDTRASATEAPLDDGCSCNASAPAWNGSLWLLVFLIAILNRHRTPGTGNRVQGTGNLRASPVPCSRSPVPGVLCFFLKRGAIRGRLREPARCR